MKLKFSKKEKENYQLSLQDYTSDSTLFKVVPAFKYQKDGDQVNTLIKFIQKKLKTLYMHI